MKMLPYNPSNKDSIIEYAKNLKGKSLRQICDDSILDHNYKGKGNFGQILEKFYFQYNPNSDSEPDFPIAGIELKATPLKTLKNKEYRSKERLVLNIINYLEVVNQDFETSSFWKKNKEILLICYLHNPSFDILDYVIKLVDNWNFPKTDLEIIKRDWAIITNKIIAGKAHELSEGDTLYLGACTKGGKGGNPRQQPNNTIQAKQRAYSLKQGYVNHMIATIACEPLEKYGKLIKNDEIVKEHSLEEIVISKFTPLYGKTDKEIMTELKIEPISLKVKDYHSRISKAIVKSVFGVPLNKKIEDYIEEFKKADIIIKTVRLKDNDLPKEDISFPKFSYLELVNEEWDESEFKNNLEQKFLFVFFQFESENLVLRKVKFWNMPYKDILESEKVWARTKEIVSNGDIVQKVEKGRRFTNFPSKKFNSVSHVRPHATNSKDTYPLPTRDKVTGDNEYTKHCFWLNNTYVKEKIYLENT